MSSEDTLVERVSSFISENKRGIVIGVAAAAVAVGGVAYYVASSRADGGARDEENLRSGKRKDKKKKRPSKTVKDPDGPILEERKSKGPEVEDGGCVFILFASVSRSLATRQTSDRGADPGSLERGKPVPNSVSTTCPFHIGAQVAGGFTEAKGQQRVSGPKLY